MEALYGAIERRLGLFVVLGRQAKVVEGGNIRSERRRWSTMKRRLVSLPFVDDFLHPGETKDFIVPRVEFGDDVEDGDGGCWGGFFTATAAMETKSSIVDLLASLGTVSAGHVDSSFQRYSGPR